MTCGFTFVAMVNFIGLVWVCASEVQNRTMDPPSIEVGTTVKRKHPSRDRRSPLSHNVRKHNTRLFDLSSTILVISQPWLARAPGQPYVCLLPGRIDTLRRRAQDKEDSSIFNFYVARPFGSGPSRKV